MNHADSLRHAAELLKSEKEWVKNRMPAMSRRRTNTDPMRTVVHATARVASSIHSDQFKFYFWLLTLECGHDVERPYRRPNRHGRAKRGFAAMHHPRDPDDVLPPPKRARCDVCAREAS